MNAGENNFFVKFLEK